MICPIRIKTPKVSKLKDKLDPIKTSDASRIKEQNMNNTLSILNDKRINELPNNHDYNSLVQNIDPERTSFTSLATMKKGNLSSPIKIHTEPYKYCPIKFKVS